MKNINLTAAFKSLKLKKWDAYYLSIANENLYEFTPEEKNYVKLLTDFSGDTASLMLCKDKAYLYVDGRFVIEAKKEVKDKRIKIVEANRDSNQIEHILKTLKSSSKLYFASKFQSIKKVLKIKTELDKKDIKFINTSYLPFPNNIDNKSSDSPESDSASLYIIDKRYVSDNPRQKIKKLFKAFSDKKCQYYITSSLEEIAYLTNLRRTVKEKDANKVLSDAFMIVGIERSYIYTDDLVDNRILKYLQQFGIILKRCNDFYDDLTKYKNKKYVLDPRFNNYYIYTKLVINKMVNFCDSPLQMLMSIKGKKEIDGLKRCNILDGVAITKALYKIKKIVKNGLTISEYDAKMIVDNSRLTIGKSNYIAPSFETIAAYKENAAICHYTPDKASSKVMKPNSVLLIDSGGNYLFGTTDITRTISLYKGKVPKTIKKHYTLVLNSMISLAMQKFPYGITGTELDIVARGNLYNEYLDFGHATGHGIGYISNVHEGPNRIGAGFIKNSETNVIQISQIVSDEPGLYFENKYGIRLENDLLTVHSRENEYGSFIGFEHLTLCPFDRDLIEEKYLDRRIIKSLNDYNALVYKKISAELDEDEKRQLKKDTRIFKIRR